MAKSLSTIRTRVRHHLKEASAKRWSDDTLNICINEAENCIVREVKMILSRDVTTDTVSGTQEYTVPTGFRYALEENGVIYTDSSSGTHEILYKAEADLIDEFDDLRTKTGTPSYYYITNDNKIGFYPIPDYSGSNNVELNYVSDGGVMTTDATNCQLPDSYFEALVAKSCENAWEYQNNPVNPVSAAGVSKWRMKYYEELRKAINTSQLPDQEHISYFGS